MPKTPQQLIGTDLTKKQVKAYMKESDKCPRCRSDAYEGEGIEVNDGKCYQNLSCNACGLMWTDEYTLTGFTYMSDSEH